MAKATSTTVRPRERVWFSNERRRGDLGRQQYPPIVIRAVGPTYGRSAATRDAGPPEDKAAERVRVVAGLRKRAAELAGTRPTMPALAMHFRVIADAIECGYHAASPYSQWFPR